MAKYCPQCYVGISADDRICRNCGAVLKEDLIQEEVIQEEMIQNDESSDKAVVISEMNHQANQEKDPFDSDQREETLAKETMSKEGKIVEQAPVLTLGDWLLTLLLLMIPIVNIVMLIIWSVDTKTNPNKRHFAWAQLIFMGIMIVLSIIFSSIFAAIIISGFNSFYY